MILCGAFCPCFPTYVDFHSCILNKVCLPCSPSLDEDIQVKAGSSRAAGTHFFLPLPLGCALPRSCARTFGCWQTPPGGGHAPVLASCTKMVLCACSLHWQESKFRTSSFCRCCSNVDHLRGLQCVLEDCQLCCDSIIACTAAEAFVLLERIPSFCNKNALSSARRPKNLASTAFKGTKVAISLYLGKWWMCD